ncbi:LysR family transcriptional regulator [Candidimonas humi]|uniref:LysR substrate-binding domain-containing protein n=1 Tax=Candidimonas humi TaxID=683355 RepID=A0ABV8P059_9BURK|nr:LysR substrate-binding domain-containing protein [Candidimonas humi]MBV6304389.1 LysR family transcriptional regulator [Candidimonas humi]
MAAHNLDINALRTFETGVALGTFAKASDRVGRSPAAVSAQLKKLEQQAGVDLFRKSGRGLALTEAGETLLSYARQILAANDAALTAIHGMQAHGKVCLGLQEDLGEWVLTDVLGRFARAHKGMRIETRVCRNAELMDRIARDELDLAVVWGNGGGAPWRETLARLPMVWIGGLDAAPQGRGATAGAGSADDASPFQLVTFEGTCLFKTAAQQALNQANITWDISFTSSSLNGLLAAVAAGLGVTIRTPIGLPPRVAALAPSAGGLPSLPDVDLTMISSRAEHSPAVAFLADALRTAIHHRLPH